MRKLVAPLLLMLSLMVPLAASASHSPGGGPNQDKVDGTLEDVGPTTLHVNAYSDPDGSNPGGHFWYRSEQPGFGPYDLAGEVTCVNVFAPDRAWVGGRIDRAKLPGLPGEGDGFLFLIVDTGEPADANPLMSDSHTDFPLADPPAVCPTGGVFYFQHKSGNFVVHQAS
jgi:hypothetical protein